MFKVGDRIVYPSQGVGVIDFIEDIEFNGEMQSYYKIHLLNSTMKVSLPVNRVDSANIRLVSNGMTIDDNLENINKFTTDINELNSSNFKERLNINSKKFKSGTLKDYLEVICNLTQVKTQSHLNSNEQKMLDTTKKFLVEEICQSKNLQTIEAETLLEETINF